METPRGVHVDDEEATGVLGGRGGGGRGGG